MSFTSVDDFPKAVKRGTIYLIGEDANKWVAAFNCPCGCGEVVQLNLLREGENQWRFRIWKGRITIYPSVYRKYACGAHFTITHGHVRWF